MIRRFRKMIKLCFTIIVFGVIVLANAENSQATSSKWNKACNTYKKFLAKNESHFEEVEGDFYSKNKENYKKSSDFLIVDLDKNGVPELVTYHDISYKQGHLYIFTYKSGKIRRVKNSKGKNSVINVSSNAAGWYSIYKCNKNHLHCDWNGGWIGYRNSVYVIKKGKFIMYAQADVDNSKDTQKYVVNGNSANADTYISLTSKCKTKESGYLCANNSKNRKKY